MKVRNLDWCFRGDNWTSLHCIGHTALGVNADRKTVRKWVDKINPDTRQPILHHVVVNGRVMVTGQWVYNALVGRRFDDERRKRVA